MQYFLILALCFYPAHAYYAVAPSCLDYNGKDLTPAIEAAYLDATNLAGLAMSRIDDDQVGGMDNTRDLMFPNIDQYPAYYRIIKDRFAAVSVRQARQDYNAEDPHMTLVFYCGDEGWRYLNNPNSPGLFKEPHSLTIYDVGADLYQGVCFFPGTLAVTSQGVTMVGQQRLNKYGVNLCKVIDQNRVPTITDAVRGYDSLLDDGADIEVLHLHIMSAVFLHELFHVRLFKSMLPEPNNEDEETGFGPARDYARKDDPIEGLNNAIRNIDNYVFFALARSMSNVYWRDAGAHRFSESDDESG
ncbi:MAG: hypothetical protein Q9222_002872 [Ikaeria aurantiellina]